MKHLPSFLLVALFFIATTVFAADSDPMGVVMSEEEQLSTFVELIAVADLTGFANGQGNFTVLAPTNAAFDAMEWNELDALKTNANEARKFVLYHTLNGRFGSAELSGKGTVESVLGPNVLIDPGNPIRVNRSANIIQTDLESTNAVIHIIDAGLDPDSIPQPPPPEEAPAEGEDAPPAEEEEEKPPWYVEPQPVSDAVLGQPGDNPAFVSGGYIDYRSGVLADSSSCKGMTWVVLRQMNGVTEVGADRMTNPYRGDTSCNEFRQLLCFERNMHQPPSSDYSDGWAFGTARATVAIPGTRLQTRGHGDAICQNTFGHTYRMAEFHDAALGGGVGGQSGWKFWAYGGLGPGQRFWVAISDQAANPWNSYQPPHSAAINTWVDQILWAGQDPAFVGSGHMMPGEGLAASRSVCQGTTWVIHRQFDGLLQVGADRISNPYKGDQNCDQRFPVLCVKVQGHGIPANTNNANFNHGWSGAEIGTTYPLSGHDINTRDKANNACREAFGGGWRMATHHDGALGTEGTDGWKFWGYGGLPTGRRFWVAVNDQPANPWNFTE